MRHITGWIIAAFIMLLVDLYVFNTVRYVIHSNNEKTKWLGFVLYWIIAALAVLIVFLLLPNSRFFSNTYLFKKLCLCHCGRAFFAKLVASLFFLADDIRRGLLWLMAKIFPRSGVDFVGEKHTISRSAFLSWTGIAAGTALFGSLLYGFSNKYNYTIKRIALSFPNLPAAFNGFKIVQISDIHSGSFENKAAVSKGVDMILNEKARPDFLFYRRFGE